MLPTQQCTLKLSGRTVKEPLRQFDQGFKFRESGLNPIELVVVALAFERGLDPVKPLFHCVSHLRRLCHATTENLPVATPSLTSDDMPGIPSAAAPE